LFRVNIYKPLQRLDITAKEHLEILDACRDQDPDLAVSRLASHVEISREHTLGLRPVRWGGDAPQTAKKRRSQTAA
jgi:DNA-binding GntR family transcriptional regulator